MTNTFIQRWVLTSQKHMHGKTKDGATSLPMRSMFFCTWGTHCLRTANSSGMVVPGSRRTSLHCSSLGSKKENSGGGRKEGGTTASAFCREQFFSELSLY